MKRYIYMILSISILIVNFSNAQNPFEGTWEWQNNSYIFRVYLGQNNPSPKQGHFEMVEIGNNGEEIIIYTSDKPYNSVTPQHWHPVILAGWNGDDTLSGRILDNSLDYEDPQWDGYQFWHSWLEMKIISTNPIQATWKVNYKDITPENALPINIPQDIIMTKVE